MLFVLHLRSKWSDENATSGRPWDIYSYFELCQNFNKENVFWTLTSILCFATGFPACVLILRKMFKRHWGGTPLTPNSLFILHLTIMDTIFLTTLPLGILNYLIFRSLMVEYVWNGFYAFNLYGRPLMMTCMCLDCYVAVIHPLTYHKKNSMTPRIVMICVVWACLLVSSIFLGLFPNYLGLISLGPFIIAIVVVGICDSFILHALLKSDVGKKNIHLQKKRAVQTLVNSLVMTLLFYCPPILVQIIIEEMMSSVALFCVSTYLGSTIGTLGSAVMPILHIFNRKKQGCQSFRWSLNICCCPKQGNLDLGKSPSD